MEKDLNAVGYSYNAINYTKELQSILHGVYACYTLMLKDNIELPNDENEIRNKLLLKYLRNDAIREKTGLSGNFIFDREVPEDNTKGRTDIKIQTIQTFTKSEAYYIIECKRLDDKKPKGSSGLNAEYINEGIYRFVSKHYSTYHRVNAMFGFVVEQMNIRENIENLNSLLRNPKLNKCNTIQEIRQATFIPDFDFHYSSIHNDSDNNEFILYHLMFDFSNNINHVQQ
jgi:hypothetical protein